MYALYVSKLLSLVWNSNFVWNCLPYKILLHLIFSHVWNYLPMEFVLRVRVVFISVWQMWFPYFSITIWLRTTVQMLQILTIGCQEIVSCAPRKVQSCSLNKRTRLIDQTADPILWIIIFICIIISLPFVFLRIGTPIVYIYFYIRK